MATPADWTDLETRFRALPRPYFDLHATHTGTSAEYEQRARELRELAAVAVPDTNPLDGTSARERLELRAAGYEAAAIENPDGLWIVSGGPANDQQKESLQAQFRALAIEAAVAAQVVTTGASAEDAVHAWLNLLKGGPGCNGLWIENLPEASAIRCAGFRAKVVLDDHNAQSRAVVASIEALSSIHGNKDRVDAYIGEVQRATGRMISRKEIWSQWYRDSSEFFRWQRGDLKTSNKARERFDGVLRDKPHLPKTGH